VPLEVCPTSNERLHVVPSVAVHPVKSFLDAGIAVVVSSDDPSLFGTDVVNEHVRLHLEAGVPLATLGACAASSFHAALLPAEEREERFADAVREALAWAEAAS
jgi:adenosine deaminase